MRGVPTPTESFQGRLDVVSEKKDNAAASSLSFDLFIATPS